MSKASDENRTPEAAPESAAPLPILEAVRLHQTGRLTQAEVIYRDILRAEPEHFDALQLLGTLHAQRGQPASAVELFGRALENRPQHVGVLNNHATALSELGRHDEALRVYERLLAIKPDYARALEQRGNLLLELRRPEEALASYDDLLRIEPHHAAALSGRGIVLCMLGRPEEALPSFDRALAIDPKRTGTLNNRGNALSSLRRYEEALQSYARVLAIRPGHIDALSNRGHVLAKLNRPEDALDSFDRALGIDPNRLDVLVGRGNALLQLGRAEAALDAFDRALAIDPGNLDVLGNRANAFLALNRPLEALDVYDHVLALDPQHAGAFNNRGSALFCLNRHIEALASYDCALAIRPDYPEALGNRGDTLSALQRVEEAFDSYGRCLAIKPDLDFLFGSWLHAKMKLCDWRDLEGQFVAFAAQVESGAVVSAPFPALAVPLAAALQRKLAETRIRVKHPRQTELSAFGPGRAHERIRVGYFSADFRDHAVSYLMAGVIEHHDRSQFLAIGISLGSPTSDAMQARLRARFEQFIEVGNRSDFEVARLARELELDIAVDLGGFTADSRTGIFAFGAAPVQVNFLGYPGTMGADYIHYLIGDRTLVPEEHRQFYSEKIAYLPHAFQPNDSQRAIPKAPSKRDVGLPESGFIFCCFNASYKLNPAVFDVWLTLLGRVEGARLWLVADTKTQERNLVEWARRKGVPPERLIFAPRTSYSEYLARYSLADLVLDCSPFNGGTTTSDALWAGVPVLTCAGNAMAGRMAASLLSAVGLPELITHSLKDYEALAVELATHAERLSSIRQRLAQNRLTHPLFDTPRFTRDLESAFTAMQERHQAGLLPDHIYVKG